MVPVKFATGVKVKLPFALSTSVPSPGGGAATSCAVRLACGVSGSVSLSSTLPVTTVSSGLVKLSLTPTGGGATGAVTVRVTVVAGSLLALPSLARYVKLSPPEKPAFGE